MREPSVISYDSLLDGQDWLNNVWENWCDNRFAVDIGSESFTGISQAAFHSQAMLPSQNPVSQCAMLLLFREQAHTVALIRHAMNYSVNILNPGQIPILNISVGSASVHIG